MTLKVYGPYRRADGRQHVIHYDTSTGKRTTQSYPRYLMEQFLGRELEEYEQVDHVNEDCTDDRIENFQLTSQLENNRKNTKHRRDSCNISNTNHYTIKRNKVRYTKKIVISVILIVGMILTSASACEKAIDDIMRVLGNTPGTFYNYGADGQVVFEARCASLAFTRDTEYDRYSAEGKKIEDSSVVKVSCGKSLFSTVGFTSVYITDGAKDNLMANSQQFANLRIKNNDRGVPLINYLWRDVKNLFVGTARVAQVCDQNNNPILAFASMHVTGHATDVDKSTMFQLDDSNNDGYVWISRGSYTVLDTALLN
jgi:Domain of unknown function (DUF5052)/HNH endonuclease